MRVSCIMPTADRRPFIPRSIEYFLRQDYAERELVIVDDGADAVEDLVPADSRIRYLRIAPGLTLGAKRNRACQEARSPIIAHWDDDDWHAPHRLSRQVDALLASGADMCGIDRALFYAPGTGRAWEYAYPRGRGPWLSGSTLVYRRSFWERHPFADLDVGEDARFVWDAAGAAIHVLQDHTFHVGMVHDRNTSPKQTGGVLWREISPDAVRSLLGRDLDALTAQSPAPCTPAPGAASVRPLHNVFACLVHEATDCVVDLVHNLRHLDPSSVILLYNGGDDPGLLTRGVRFPYPNVFIHPDPKPMRWGALHGFALDCMRFARQSLSFDTLTIVDSDQLGARAGYSARLAGFLAGEENVGLLGNSPGPQGPRTRIPPAATAWREFELWRPFLRRFPDGEQKWVHWSFWPATVLTADACGALVDLLDHDDQLRQILRASRLWATEEILFPTLTALLGFRVLANPFSGDYVKYRADYSRVDLAMALRRDDVYWVHPVPRRYDDRLRRHLRRHFHHYEQRTPVMIANASEPRLLLTLPLLSRMKEIEGWLGEDEADLLIAATRAACPAGEPGGCIVEVGSYCGRSTVVLASAARAFGRGARVYAVDPHEGTVGAADQGVTPGTPTLERLLGNLAAAGVEDTVEVVRKHPWEVEWSQPIGLLFIDGLHDYPDVARDFNHFEPWLAPGAFVAFHDYADYYPGVMAFVNELLERGAYRAVHRASSMILLQRAGGGGENGSLTARNGSLPLGGADPSGQQRLPAGWAADLAREGATTNAVESVPVWLYWEGAYPEWIRACHETMMAHVPGLRLLTPEIFDVLRDRDRDIDLRQLHVAHRADFVRAFMLARYGGLWLDSDCLVMRPLDDVLKLVAEHEFVGYRQRDGEVANNFMGARPGSRTAGALYRQICRILRAGRQFSWTTLGSTLLTRILAVRSGQWHELPSECIEPICWSNPGAFFALDSAEGHARAIVPGAFCYMLSNNMVEGFGRTAQHPLQHPDSFFSYLLSRSLADAENRCPTAVRASAQVGVPYEPVFRAMGDMHRHHRDESISGPGSSLAETRQIRAGLPPLLAELGVRSLLDAPCGDFNWMKEVALDSVEYLGVDVQHDLVEENGRRYAGPRRRFQRLDLLSDDLPTADCILCRDCLVHLTLAEIGLVLRNFKRSGARYLLTTTFTGHPCNEETSRGQWRTLNLETAPFGFPPALRLLNEGSSESGGAYADKCLGLWRLEDLPIRTADEA